MAEPADARLRGTGFLDDDGEFLRRVARNLEQIANALSASDGGVIRLNSGSMSPLDLASDTRTAIMRIEDIAGRLKAPKGKSR